jgi:hypothetical protein
LQIIVLHSVIFSEAQKHTAIASLTPINDEQRFPDDCHFKRGGENGKRKRENTQASLY